MEFAHWFNMAGGGGGGGVGGNKTVVPNTFRLSVFCGEGRQNRPAEVSNLSFTALDELSG